MYDAIFNYCVANANSYGNVNHALHLLALTVLCNFIYFLPDRPSSFEGLQADKWISTFLHSHEGQRFAARLLLTSNDRSPKIHGIPKDESDKAE